MIHLAALASGILMAAMLTTASPAQAGTPGQITGVGGIFVRSRDPKALSAWYRDVLGLTVESWGGAMLRADTKLHPPVLVWNPVSQTSEYLNPSTREFMLNFAVDDLDAFVAKLEAKHVAILKREDGPQGRFAWILDPDGTKIELWEPKR